MEPSAADRREHIASMRCTAADFAGRHREPTFQVRPDRAVCAHLASFIGLEDLVQLLKLCAIASIYFLSNAR